MQTVGQRIKLWRRRRGGMSQRTLADLAGLSPGYIGQIETGQAPLDKKATQVAIARALNISVAQLLGKGDPDDPMRQQVTAHVPAIESALVELTYGEPRTPTRDREALRAAVRVATDVRNATDYARLAPVLPDLLLDLHGHGADMAPELVVALYETEALLKAVGCRSAALRYAEAAVRVAQTCDDDVLLGSARFAVVTTLTPENAATGLRLAARLADDLQGETQQDAQAVYGMAHLAAAMHAATTARADEARAHLDEAAGVARVLGEPLPAKRPRFELWFGPTNTNLWKMCIAAELRDIGTALAVAPRVDLSVIPSPSRHGFFYIDLARALAADGRRDREAMHALAKGERAAPQHLRFNPVATNLVTTIITRARRKAVADEMLSLARKLGLDPL